MRCSTICVGGVGRTKKMAFEYDKWRARNVFVDAVHLSAAQHRWRRLRRAALNTAEVTTA